MDPAQAARWRLWRPVRRYFLWRYTSYEPPQAELILPEKTLELNTVGTLLWEHLDGTRLASHLVDLLQEAYPSVPVERLTRDLFNFLLFCHKEQVVYLDWEPLQ